MSNLNYINDLFKSLVFPNNLTDYLITHNQQVNPINEIIFTRKCQEN